MGSDRYSNVRWDPATVTVGEYVVSEGLADAFARHLYGDLGYTRIGVPSLSDDAVYDKVIGGSWTRISCAPDSMRPMRCSSTPRTSSNWRRGVASGKSVAQCFR
ncbi:DUF2268 domain-containing putative Zn-dependent protease [Nocardia sp. NPDC060256]|uniref:DUF2268 domain-containing putative Zn-dependent protease n=1 Tax=unclassified Nocardia TaxID=2637762 RepID=UPI00364D99DA